MEAYQLNNIIVPLFLFALILLFNLPIIFIALGVLLFYDFFPKKKPKQTTMGYQVECEE